MEAKSVGTFIGDARPGYEYVISGYTDDGYVCVVKHSFRNKFGAKFVLDKMLSKPTKVDEFQMKGLHNFFVEEVKSDEMWWNDKKLCN